MLPVKKHAHLSWTIAKICMVLPYFYCILQHARKMSVRIAKIWCIKQFILSNQFELYCLPGSHFQMSCVVLPCMVVSKNHQILRRKAQFSNHLLILIQLAPAWSIHITFISSIVTARPWDVLVLSIPSCCGVVLCLRFCHNTAPPWWSGRKHDAYHTIPAAYDKFYPCW
jgi:hypothetical protein